MTMERKSVDISNIPELVALAEQVQQTQESQVLTRGQEPLAVLEPLTDLAPATQTDTNPNAWLEPLIGAFHSQGPGDVSANKKKYLADAYYGKRNSHDQL
jgi:hypothetical protein